jgi:hypothetical protein
MLVVENGAPGYGVQSHDQRITGFQHEGLFSGRQVADLAGENAFLVPG